MTPFDSVEFVRYSAHWLVESYLRIGFLAGGLLFFGWLAYVRHLDRKQFEREEAAMLQRRARIIAITDYSQQAKGQKRTV